MVKSKIKLSFQDAKGLMKELRESQQPNKTQVEIFLMKLGLFHIYALNRALNDLDARTRNAALKKVEHFLPQLLSDEKQHEEAVRALEMFFEPIRMLDEDA